MKERKKNNIRCSNVENGITLIALIITIIVLLILAGVSLSLIVGENGILKKATSSAEATKKGVAIEQVSLAWSACQTDYLTSGSGSEKSTFFTKEKLNENVSQGEFTQVNFEKDETGVSEVIYELDNSSYTIEITKNGEVSIVGDTTNPVKTKYSVIKTIEGTGITFSNNEETVEEGVAYNTNISIEGNYILETVTVMMAGTEVTTGITIADNKKSGTINIGNVSGNIEIRVVAIEETQEYRAKNPIVPTGFTHITGEWNTGYVIQETSTGDEFVWIPVVSEASYARKSGSKNYHMSGQYVDDSGKDVLQYVNGDKLELSTILGNTITETQRNGTTPANIPEKEVVCNAGGFYVSRYEIGIKERKTAASANQGTADWTKENLVSQAGKEPARNISQTQALAASNSWKTGENYQSGLITGTAWDTMCNFIGWSKCDGDCTSWGNYSNNLSKAYTNIDIALSTSGVWTSMTSWQRIVNVNETKNVFQTGRFVNKDGVTTAQNNIYDIAGNVWEWTTEIPTQDTTHRVYRGGSVSDDGNDQLASCRHGYGATTLSDWHVGFRTVLYVTK